MGAIFVRFYCAYTPTRNTPSHYNHDKISVDGFPFLSYMGMGLHLEAPWVTGALLVSQISYPYISPMKIPNIHSRHSMLFSILAFWLVLIYNLLEHRWIDDIISGRTRGRSWGEQGERGGMGRNHTAPMLPFICSQKAHILCQSVIRISVTHSSDDLCATLFVL